MICIKMYDFNRLMNNTSTYTAFTYKDLSLLMLYILNKPYETKILSRRGTISLLEYNITNLSNFNSILKMPYDFLEEFIVDTKHLMDNGDGCQLIVFTGDWLLNMDDGLNGIKYDSMHQLLVDLSTVYSSIHIFDKHRW